MPEAYLGETAGSLFYPFLSGADLLLMPVQGDGLPVIAVGIWLACIYVARENRGGRKMGGVL